MVVEEAREKILQRLQTPRYGHAFFWDAKTSLSRERIWGSLAWGPTPNCGSGESEGVS